MSIALHLWRLVIITILYTSLKSSAVAEDSLHAIFTGLKCTNRNRDMVKEFTCDLKPDSKGLPLWSVNLTVNQDVTDLEFRYKLLVERDGKYNPAFAMNIDYCREWTNLKNNIMLQFMVKELARVSNMECPLKKNSLYYVRNYNLTVFEVPKYVPELTFMALSDFYVQNKSVCSIQHFGKLLRLTKQNVKEIREGLKYENE